MSSPNQQNFQDHQEESEGWKKLTEGLNKVGRPLENISSQSNEIQNKQKYKHALAKGMDVSNMYKNSTPSP